MNEARQQSRAIANHQMAMAKNIAHLKNKAAKQEQVRKLCGSLKRTIIANRKPMGFSRTTERKPESNRNEIGA